MSWKDRALGQDTVRGVVHQFLLRCHRRGLFRFPVLEIGTRVPDPGCWWADNSWLYAGGESLRIDMKSGHNVDLACDVTEMTHSGVPPEHFNCVLVSETLEHVADADLALRECWYALRPGGVLLVTVPFCYPYHAYPADYWRWTPEGLGLALRRAGFRDTEVTQGGGLLVTVSDHGEQATPLPMPTHSLAVAFRHEMLET